MKEKIAKKILEIGAVFFSPNKPFVWTSGIKSPVYCDNRLILTYPEIRIIIEKSICEIIKRDYPTCELIMGTSTAGIAHAAIVAHILDLPMGYVRSAAKGHGRLNRIEGKIKEGNKIVVIEDLISTGGSVIDTVNCLREAKAEVLGVVSIFTYAMKLSVENLKKNNIKNISLLDLDYLVNIAKDNNYIKPEYVRKIYKFRDKINDNK